MNELVLERISVPALARFGFRMSAVSFAVLLLLAITPAQVVTQSETGEKVYVIEGTTDPIVYGLGRSIKITGTVKEAIALGGDVIVQGTVEGDVAAVGGSVIQLEGSRIGGDVIVVGGIYRHADESPNRKPGSTTMMIAGYEQQLRNMMRNPSDVLRPHWSAGYVGWRLLALLFWFVVSIALTAAMPGTISRGVARLQLTSIRVAAIGLLGAVIIGMGVPVSLHYLPNPINVLVGLLALLLIIIAGVFGRVVIYAATGRWLQRKYLRVGRTSESVALLLGTAFWITLSSLPYIWPLVVAVVLVTSLGLALTARYRVGWGRRQAA